MSASWHLQGEFISSCNCEVFCPCVISLGRQRPTKGYCHGLMGFWIESGRYGEAALDALTVLMLVDIPSAMRQGNWQAALYIDERAGDQAAHGLEQIFRGRAGGAPGLFSLLISEHLGTRRMPITYHARDASRTLNVGKQVAITVNPIKGARKGEPVVVTNSEYWIAPEIVVCETETGRLRDWGRVWDLNGLSGEFCKISWNGP